MKGCEIMKKILLTVLSLSLLLLLVACSDEDINMVSGELNEVSNNIELVSKNVITLKISNPTFEESGNKFKLSEEDSDTLKTIISNLKWKNETCDGISEYSFELDGNQYGIELYDGKIHIVDFGKEEREAIITGEEYMKLKQIIATFPRDAQEQSVYSFIAKVVESNEKTIIVEPLEDELIRKSADKISIGIGNTDALYAVGSYVYVEYDGDVMESYPAQVRASKIQALNSQFYNKADTFNIIFNEDKTKGKQEIYKASNYKVYLYNGDAKIVINNTDYSLKEALEQNKIAMEDIIAKANEEVRKNEEFYKNAPESMSIPQLLPYSEMYRDGGSIEYNYGSYKIIKCHTINGNRDVYIGNAEMNINDLNID